jgi:hypothetical protein
LAASVLLVAFLTSVCEGKILGVFQGKIIKASSSGGKRVLYVQGKSGFVRKVDVAHATVEYDDDFPVGIRTAKPADSLRVATNVRITAEQKSQVWLASEILILAPSPSDQPKQSASSAGSIPRIK